MASFIFQQSGGGGGGAFVAFGFTGTTIAPTTDGFQRWLYQGSTFLTLAAIDNTATVDASVLKIVAGNTYSITVPEGLTGIVKLNGPWEGTLGQCLSLQYGATLGGFYETGRS